MSDVKQLALDAVEGRKEAELRDYAKKIIEIFKISNTSKELKKSIWQVRLIDYRGRAHSIEEFENCLIMISFEQGENAQFSNILVFDFRERLIGKSEELKQYIRKLKIPTELLEDIIKYFKENLSEYFIATKEDPIRFKIELKSNNY